jgi:hypothetical protein
MTIIYALPFPTSLITAGGLLTVQALFTDGNTAGELIAGSLLVSVGFIALRMILKAAEHERHSFTILETRYLRRIEDLEADLKNERQVSRELRFERDTERTLRLSLEEAGIADRRHRPGRLVSDTDTDGLLTTT